MKGPKILRNKYFLYATEFFAGMSVMAIELGASRLLAPYFSSSQIVWTIIIGTIMIAMACGNIWGGRLSDKNPDPSRLYSRLLLCALWTALIPFAGKYVIGGVSLGLATFLSTNFLPVAAFTSCFLIFVFPLMLLGTVTPSLVKYTVSSLDSTGKTVGELGALNTIGSIIGTFVPTFITIPAVGTAATFAIFSGILAALSVIYFVSAGGNRGKSAAVSAVIVACALLSPSYSFAFWNDGVIYEGESIYNYLQVNETEESVILSTNVLFGVQSIMQKQEGLTGMYYDYALAAPVMAGFGGNKGGDILILGLGTGTFATQCARYFSSTRITGVEIDDKIAALATEYFRLPEAVETVIGDGRAFLRTSGTYDVIMVDAYQDITIPFQMSTTEFFTAVYDRLNDGGIMVVNMNMRSTEKGSINDYLCDTIAGVFGDIYMAQVAYSTNCEVFAGKGIDPKAALEDGLLALSAGDLKTAASACADALTPHIPGGLILTDDKAPVEILGMRALDEIISAEIEYYRDIYFK